MGYVPWIILDGSPPRGCGRGLQRFQLCAFLDRGPAVVFSAGGAGFFFQVVNLIKDALLQLRNGDVTSKDGDLLGYVPISNYDIH